MVSSRHDPSVMAACASRLVSGSDTLSEFGFVGTIGSVASVGTVPVDTLQVGGERPANRSAQASGPVG